MPRKTNRSKNNHRFRPISRGDKPGSIMEHWAKHPEEVDAFLESHGVDLEEMDRVLARGEGRLPVGDLAYPPDQRKSAEARSRTVRSTT